MKNCPAVFICSYNLKRYGKFDITKKICYNNSKKTERKIKMDEKTLKELGIERIKISYTPEDNFLKIRNEKDIADSVITEKFIYVKKFRIPLIGVNVWRKSERIYDNID